MSIRKVKRACYALVIVLLILNSSVVSFECGVRKNNIIDTIVLGEQTRPGDWPWHAAIYHRINTRTTSYACGGTLISEYFVLTAIHCVKGENGFVLARNKIVVRLGVHKLLKIDPKAFQEHDVQSIHKYGDTTKPRNDIALLELETQVEFNTFVQPACVNQVEDLTHSSGIAIGWGADETDELSPVLKSATMPVVSGYQCVEHNDGVFRLVLDSSLFCAGFANGTNVCNGDSGGGLHFEREGVWYVGGIVSFTAQRSSSNLCHTESYALFTNVYQFLPWIRRVTQLPYLGKQIETKLLPTKCGQTVRNRISRGKATKVFDYPWMAILQYGTNQDFSCSGSIINQRYILTAAQCLTNRIDHVILGEHTKSSEFDCNIIRGRDGEETERECADPIKHYQVESYLRHPEYNTKLANDIGLVRLATDILWEYHIQPICLPVSPQLRVKQLRQYVVTGWGLNENYDLPDVLQEATLPQVNIAACQRRYSEIDPRRKLSEKQMCAGGESQVNTCNGDAGGPLGYVANYGGMRFVQFGIVSYGVNGCGAPMYPTVFTRVASYMDWILQNIMP